MKNGSSKIIDILQWCFVAFCLLLAIGVGFGAGCIMLLATAALALPIKPIRNVWNTVLGVRKIIEIDEPDAKWWELKKKKAQKKRRAEKEDQKSRKMLKPLIIGVVFIIAFSLGMGQMESNEPPADPGIGIESSSSATDETASSETSTDATEESSEPETEAPTEDTTSTSEPTTTPTVDNKEPELSNPTDTSFDISSIPAYSGKAYIAVNNNIPYFTDNELTTTSYEYYSSLDSLGRCGVTYACVGTDLMPTEDRGSIGQVKPTGWQTVKYDIVDGKYLYNRCHLIGYQLSGENANTRNLITGTRYLNIDGMLPFENMVADYVKETENHVMYRVTPIFEGNNLLATGVLMEGYSVEDDGDGICFNVFCYNVQPGITIDYADGSNHLTDTGSGTENTTAPTEPPKDNTTNDSGNSGDSGTTYILNTSTKKFHKPSCSSVDQMNESNKAEYTGSREDLINQGYDPCKRCHP